MGSESIGFMIDRARNDPRRGTLQIDSTEVPYLDVRAEPSEHAQAQLRQFAQETLVLPGRAPGLQGIAITVPQPSDGLALTLATRGIHLIATDVGDPLPAVLDRFQKQMQLLRAANPPGATASGHSPSASSTSMGAAFTPSGGSRGTSPYAQRPLGFNEALYNEWMTQLTTPWREEDAWKSES
jgi:hypothetical protein